MDRIKEYFYGIRSDLSPHSTVLEFKAVKIFKIGGGPQAPLSALPIGAGSTVDPIRLVETTPNNDMLHSVLAVSYAKSVDKILQSNVAGYLYVYEVRLVVKI